MQQAAHDAATSALQDKLRASSLKISALTRELKTTRAQLQARATLLAACYAWKACFTLCAHRLLQPTREAAAYAH